MKKILLISLLTTCISSTAFASIFDAGVPCPKTFPTLPLVKITTSVPGYYVDQSADSAAALDVILVQADSSSTAKTVANAIDDSGLTSVWTQAAVFTQSAKYTIYYCAYSSTKYQLSTENLNQLKQNPQEAADYLIIKGKS